MGKIGRLISSGLRVLELFPFTHDKLRQKHSCLIQCKLLAIRIEHHLKTITDQKNRALRFRSGVRNKASLFHGNVFRQLY